MPSFEQLDLAMLSGIFCAFPLHEPTCALEPVGVEIHLLQVWGFGITCGPVPCITMTSLALMCEWFWWPQAQSGFQSCPRHSGMSPTPCSWECWRILLCSQGFGEHPLVAAVVLSTSGSGNQTFIADSKTVTVENIFALVQYRIRAHLLLFLEKLHLGD